MEDIHSAIKKHNQSSLKLCDALIHLIVFASPEDLVSLDDKVSSSIAALESFDRNEVRSLADALKCSNEDLVQIVPQIGRRNRIKESLERYNYLIIKITSHLRFILHSRLQTPALAEQPSAPSAPSAQPTNEEEPLPSNAPLQADEPLPSDEPQHAYNDLVNLRGLFAMPIEKHQLYQRLKAGVEGYRGRDILIKLNLCKAACCIITKRCKKYFQNLNPASLQQCFSPWKHYLAFAFN